MCVCMCTYIHTYIHTYVCVCVRARARAFVRVELDTILCRINRSYCLGIADLVRVDSYSVVNVMYFSTSQSLVNNT